MPNSQIIVNAVVTASSVMLVGSGFLLIYRTTRFFHFAHGLVFASSAYFVFLLTSWFTFPIVTAAFLAVVFAAAIGCLMDILVYRPLRHRRASPLVLLLASLGLYVLLQNGISMVFGDDTKSIRSGVVTEGIAVWGARVTPIQITTICVSAALVALLLVLLRRTRMGRAMRAVANDPELALVSGINSDRVILWAFGVGSALAGVAGILAALDVDMTPTMGMNALLLGVVAVIVGGIDSIPGLVMGALLVVLAQQVGAWYVGSQWQDAIVFVILLAFLLVRPQGFLGREIKKATV